MCVIHKSLANRIVKVKGSGPNSQHSYFGQMSIKRVSMANIYVECLFSIQSTTSQEQENLSDNIWYG